MKFRDVLIQGSLVALCAIATHAGAQGKPKPKPRIVQGTTQLAGDDGKINVTYTIGATEPVNITLTEAKFTVERMNIGGYTHAPSKTQKMLVLTLTIQNPTKTETGFNNGTLKFTAVDQDNENRPGIGEVVRKGSVEPLDISLKPAQKIEVQTAILVPA
ncbi:MAG: hypothetical protein QOJ65_2489, partial [Fimbriimonadaceae bacterium]|nr:hypothetical protein [Fimbriimonadaceae bacterium]